MKTCTRCSQQKPYSMFYKQAVNSKDGYQAHCKSCDNKRKAIWKKNNPEAAKLHASISDLKRSGSEHRRARNARWKKNNPHKVLVMDANRRAAKLKRTPAWLTEVDRFEIDCIYNYASALRRIGLDYHVDHVIPLQGKLVSGLHVPKNLQVITGFDNLQKSNKF